MAMRASRRAGSTPRDEIAEAHEAVQRPATQCTAVMIPHGSHRTVRQSLPRHSATEQMRWICSHASRRMTVGQSQQPGQQLEAGVIMQSASTVHAKRSFESVDPSPGADASSSVGAGLGSGSVVSGGGDVCGAEAALVVVAGALALSPPQPSEPRTSAKSTERAT